MLPNVPCTISKPSESLLTMESGDEGAHLVIVHPTGNPGEQEWVVEHRSENTIAMRNLKHDKYLGVIGEICMNASIVVTSIPFEWTLEEEHGRYCHRIYVEGEGEILYLEMSMLRMYPPQSALLPLSLAGEPWTFRFSD